MPRSCAEVDCQQTIPDDHTRCMDCALKMARNRPNFVEKAK